MNEWAPKPTTTLLPDVMRTPLKRDGTREQDDFKRHLGMSGPIRKHVKQFSPLSQSERKGPLYGFPKE